MIIADACLYEYRTVVTSFSSWALAAAQRDADWHGPDYLPIEVTSAVIRCCRRVRLDAEQTRKECARALRMGATVHGVSLNAVAQLATERSLSAYDAGYAVVARGLGVRVVTNDGPFLTNDPEWTFPLRWFAEALPMPSPGAHWDAQGRTAAEILDLLRP